MRRTAKRSVALLLLLVAVAAATPPASAAPPPATPFFSTISGSTAATPSGSVAVVGHFKSLQRDDILWYAFGTATDHLWRSVGGTQVWQKAPLAQQIDGTYEPYVGDFAGSAHDDILWEGRYESTTVLWTSNGDGTFTESPFTLPEGVVRVLDNSSYGAAKDDLLVSPTSRTGLLVDFPDSGTGTPTTTSVPRAGWSSLIGDFDGDGDADVFDYRPGTASDALLRRAGTDSPTFSPLAQTVNGTYNPVVGQFSGGGGKASDIIWFGSCFTVGSDTACAGATGGVLPFWEGGASGTFRRSNTGNVRSQGQVYVIDRDVNDLVLVVGIGSSAVPDPVDVVWYDTPSGSRTGPTGNPQIDPNRTLVGGRFRTTDRVDVLVPGPAATARLLHPRST